jgi:hypothetical protein
LETFECAGNRPEEPEMSARTERAAPDIVPPQRALGRTDDGGDPSALPGRPNRLHQEKTAEDDYGTAFVSAT